jgi:hypothetical protein
MTKPISTTSYVPPRRRHSWHHALASGDRPCVDWRNVLARKIAADENRTYSFPLDRQIRKLIHVYRYELAAKPLPQSHRGHYSAFCAARELLTKRIARLRLEAAIVNRLPPEQTADRLGLSRQVVELYEAAFFDVRPYLGGHIAFSAHVLPPVDKELERNFVLKVAYDGGYIAAEEVIDHLRFFGMPHDLSTREGRARELTEMAMLASGIDWNATDLSPAKLLALYQTGESEHSTAPSFSDRLRPVIVTWLERSLSAAEHSIDSKTETGNTPADQQNAA